MKPGDKPPSRLFGIEENPEGFDNFRTGLLTRFTPAITRLHWMRVACTLHNSQPGHLVLLRVEKSEQVHSVVGNGTWTRMDAGNRQLNAVEIADLADTDLAVRLPRLGLEPAVCAARSFCDSIPMPLVDKKVTGAKLATNWRQVGFSTTRLAQSQKYPVSFALILATE